MSIDRVSISSNQGIDRSQAAQPNESTHNALKDRQVPAGSDSIALSSRASDLSRIANVIEQSRAERLKHVLAELEAGTYQVSANDLARKLIDSNLK